MHAVAFSLDGQKIAAGGRNGKIRIWDAASGKTTTEFQAHRQRIRSIEFVSNQEVVSAGDDQQIFITNINRPEQAKPLPRIGAKHYCVKSLPNGMLATGGSDNKIRIWQLSNLSQIGTLEGHTGTVTGLDAQNGQLVSGSYDTQVRVWNDETVTTASNPPAARPAFQPASFRPAPQTPAPTFQGSATGFQPPGRVGSQPSTGSWNRKIN